MSFQPIRLASVAAAMSVLAFSAHAADEVTGAGASFPAPIYSKWAEAYNVNLCHTLVISLRV